MADMALCILFHQAIIAASIPTGAMSIVVVIISTVIPIDRGHIGIARCCVDGVV